MWTWKTAVPLLAQRAPSLVEVLLCLGDCLLVRFEAIEDALVVLLVAVADGFLVGERLARLLELLLGGADAGFPLVDVGLRRRRGRVDGPRLRLHDLRLVLDRLAFLL